MQNLRQPYSIFFLIISSFLCCSITSAGVSTSNLILNNGFETGDFSGWTQNGDFTYTQVANVASAASLSQTVGVYDGSDSALLGTVGSDASLSQLLNTVPGTRYTLSLYLASDGATPNDFLASVSGTTVIDQSDLSPQGYIFYSADFTATESSTELNLQFRNDPGYLGLDNVNVSASSVPEPGSMLLVASLVCLVVSLPRVRRKAIKDL